MKIVIKGNDPKPEPTLTLHLDQTAGGGVELIGAIDGGSGYVLARFYQKGMVEFPIMAISSLGLNVIP